MDKIFIWKTIFLDIDYASFEKNVAYHNELWGKWLELVIKRLAFGKQEAENLI